MRLYLMWTGTIQGKGLPVPAYLIQTDDGRNILVDTGFSRHLVGAYRHSTQSLVHMDEADYLENQLARLGLTTRAIDYLVITHFDPDHAGNIGLFANGFTQIVAQRRLYQAAQEREVDRFERTAAEWAAPGLNYHLVEGDTTLVEGVHLIETSGHVPGHQSVLVRLPQTGPVLLAADAISFTTHTEAATRPIDAPFDLDEAGVRASTGKLMDLARREGVSLLVCGHDRAQWEQLRLLPDYYA